MFKTRMTGNAINIVASVFILTAAAGFSQTAHAADKKKETKPRIEATSNAKALSTLTDKESQAVSLAAGRILHHIDAARQAITDKKKDEVAQHIDQGLKLVQIIENAVPKHKVTTDITSGDTSYHQEEEVAQRYVPIYDEQHVEDIVMPVVQANKGIAGSAQTEGKKTGGSDEKKGAAFGTEPLEDFSMYLNTSMKLDIVLARRMLDMAKKVIAESKYEEADDALLALQIHGVTFYTVTVELPLVEAADNLKLAQQQAKDGMTAEALATLKIASDDLKEYEALAGQSRADQVRELHQKIDELTKSMEGEKDLGSALEESEEEISSWWDTIVTWFKE